MRFSGQVASALLIVLLVGLAPAALAAGREQAPAPVQQCKVDDKRLTELSGLASDGEHWYGVNDGGTKITIVVLKRDCVVERTITGKIDPFDVEDLARGEDGTFWLADTGDNTAKRDTVALISVTLSGKSMVYRLTYPDGAHDVEALLLDRTGTPYLVTKNPLGNSGIYRPTAALTAPGPTPLEKVGSLQFTPTGTSGGPVLNAVSNVLVTGGAVTADGTVVALRTYTDAYLYSAPDGDVAAALKREPVRIPLPDQEQGESIAFEPDGALLAGSEGSGQPIFAVTGAADLVAAAPDARSGTQPPADQRAAPPAAAASDGGLDPLPAIGIAAIVVVGLAFVLRRKQT